ncbi:MAG: hypothetical protein JWL96_4090 [Sphingomonas bacterium]|uniref:hypothetical protein n=1 Tax=Sphingomonas bacterium TaxID=1895847 RepID=UPI0026147FEC|nr:hypothetical protein [Sphingomonas bacterium]MDB5712020.1 hypothetical protein [Sphingomonas bacterium]
MPKTLSALIVVLWLVTGCTPPTEPIKDDHKSYYGPVMRKGASLPMGMIEAICAQGTFRRCIADPGEDWDNCGDTCGVWLSGRDSQLIWARRVGEQYVVYQNVNGFNIDVEFVVLEPAQDGFREVWRIRTAQYGTVKAPAGVDPKILALVGHIFTDKNPCDADNGMANNSPECPATRRWPYY